MDQERSGSVASGASETLDLYAGYLDALEAGGGADFEELCCRHPERAADLRRLHQEWRDVEGLLERLGGVGSLERRLRGRHGAEVDPAISLEDSGPHSFDPAPASKLLTEITARGSGFARYEVRGEIGRGGQGAVLRVWDRDLRRSLALKILLEDRPAGEGPESASRFETRTLVRFLEEAQITSQLDHPGIVPVHELGLDSSGRVYFTMKLVGGRNLRAIIELGRSEAEGWSTTRVVGLLQRVCEAMAYAHAKGVIHRDLKPANVMVGRYGEVYVMDWGVAHVRGRPPRRDVRAEVGDSSSVKTLRADDSVSPPVTIEGQVIGTPAYMAPEQARGEEVDERADVYSIGAMLYHVLVGHMPYGSAERKYEAYQVLRRLLEGPAEPAGGLAPEAPGELLAICERAMAWRREERYASVAELGEDMRSFLEGRVVSAYETGAAAELRKWVKRNKGIAASIAAAFLLLVTGMTAGWILKREADRNASLATERGEALAATNESLEAKTLEAEARRKEAEEHEERARAGEQQAQEALGDFDSLALVRKLEEAEAALREVYPLGPDKIEAMEAWLRDHWVPIEAAWDQARDVLERLGPGELAGRDRFLRDTLTQLDERLREFTAGPAAPLAHLREDLAWSRVVEERTTARYRELWRETSAAIAASPLYGGLELPEQIGLVPLGADPRSGLHEFYHLRSAAPGAPLPARDPVTGCFTVTGEMGIVFVLLPGGKQLVNAQKEDPAKPNYDPEARLTELDVHEVLIDPFFLSKFELTQGQAQRLSGKENEAEFRAGQRHFGVEVTLAYPAVPVTPAYSRFPGVAHLARNGLRLPIEVEWEYACRAGTDTPWFTGPTPATLHGYENIGERSAGEQVPEWDGGDEIEPDGHVIYARVGSFAPNPFGLHDMHGNVSEECMTEARSVFRGGGFDGRFVMRGGTFRMAAQQCRATARKLDHGHDHGNGLRPACDIRQGSFDGPLPLADFPGPDLAGALCFDVDGDGWPDVLGWQGANTHRLLVNAGGRRFEDLTQAHLPQEMGPIAAAVSFDADGDGDEDLLTAQGGVKSPGRLFLNDGTGRLADESAERLPQRTNSTHAVACGDYDNDGDQDLYLGCVGDDRGEPNRLYLNDATGRFQDATDGHLPTNPGKVLDRTGAVASADVDRDGDLDVFCGNWHYTYQNRLFLNDGHACFTDVTPDHVPPMHIDRSGIHWDITSAVAFGDVDGDGDPDLVCGNGYGVRWQRNRLYFNDGSGRLTDVSEPFLPEDQETTIRVVLGDVDVDGDLDLLTANGVRPRIYLNDGGGRFRDVTTTHCPDRMGHDVTLVDVDLDRDLDLILTRFGMKLYLNRTR
jgi:serine/threonine protein kinase/formylglycine-generating enzyme required for sulfatase activity